MPAPYMSELHFNIFIKKKTQKTPKQTLYIVTFFYVSGVETVIKGGGEEDAKAKISSQ